VAGDFADPWSEQIEDGGQVLSAGVVLAVALAVTGQLIDCGQQSLPLIVFEKPLNLAHGLMAAISAPSQRQRVASKIAGLDQIAEQGVDDQQGNLAAG